MPESILVAYDGSDNADAALRYAAEISAKLGGRLTILHVLMHGRPAEELERLAEVEHIVRHAAPRTLPNSLDMPASMAEYLSHPELERARAVAEIGDYIVRGARLTAESLGAQNIATRIEDGDYADEILSAAEQEKADLVVIGRRGLGGLKSLVMGSVSAEVLKRVQCSILAVHVASD